MPKTPTASAIAPLGRREANKREKLVRIRAAARQVFLRKGFEGATVREIAAAADVAFGTLFLYAKDKKDLLLLLFEEEMPVVTEKAFHKIKADAPFVSQLISFFTEFYRFYVQTPQLSRDMLREITFGGGTVASRLWADVQDTERKIAALVARGQVDGRVSADIEPAIAAHIIFSLHRIQLRFCLDEPKPNIKASLEKLSRQFEVLFIGLEARLPSDGRQAPAVSYQDQKYPERNVQAVAPGVLMARS